MARACSAIAGHNPALAAGPRRTVPAPPVRFSPRDRLVFLFDSFTGVRRPVDAFAVLCFVQNRGTCPNPQRVDTASGLHTRNEVQPDHLGNKGEGGPGRTASPRCRWGFRRGAVLRGIHACVLPLGSPPLRLVDCAAAGPSVGAKTVPLCHQYSEAVGQPTGTPPKDSRAGPATNQKTSVHPDKNPNDCGVLPAWPGPWTTLAKRATLAALWGRSEAGADRSVLPVVAARVVRPGDRRGEDAAP